MDRDAHGRDDLLTKGAALFARYRLAPVPAGVDEICDLGSSHGSGLAVPHVGTAKALNSKTACIALLLLAPLFVRAKESAVSPTRGGHLSPQSSLRDLLNHPAFAGFGPLLLPWDDRAYDEDMPLSRIGSLLPYHSHVDPKTVTSALNRMIDDASSGKTVFYNFYQETQLQEQPTRSITGLFFFRGAPGAPFAVISPGGGFSYVACVHEGFPYAAEISSKGYNAFVLRYRAGHGAAVATQDLAAAVSFIFSHAKELEVSTDGYSLWGSSAGARMAAAVASHGVAAYGGSHLPRPSVVVMAYTAHSDRASVEPPTFVVVGEQDGIAPPSIMERRVAALRRSGTEVEFHRFPKLGHGFGPGVGTGAEGWIDDATRFWERFMRND